jgi:hypothetical protein
MIAIGLLFLSMLCDRFKSLWSVDLFRCVAQSLGHGGDGRVHTSDAFRGHLSSDHDPSFRFHRWLANLRILEVEEIKSTPFVPVSHPFVERLIGTIRREFLDHVLIWNEVDLRRKLEEFRKFITMKIAFTSRSVAALRENDLANRHPPLPSLTTTRGGTIAAVCSRSQHNLRIRHGQVTASGRVGRAYWLRLRFVQNLCVRHVPNRSTQRPDIRPSLSNVEGGIQTPLTTLPPIGSVHFRSDGRR